jgi:phosphoglycolate phosphatase-like HAD superfamily hydrolase
MDKKPFRVKKEGYPPEIKAVIFDGGGTIWDSSEGIYESYLWGFSRLGLTLPLSPRICHYLRGLRDFNTALGIAKALLWASGAFGDRESVLFLERPKANDYLKEKIESLTRENPSFPSLSKELAQLFDEYLYNNVRDETYPLLPHAAEILEKIHGAGYQLVLVTIRRSLSAKGILTYRGLQRHFSHILSTEGHGEGRKDVGAAKEVVKRLMIPPSHMLWVGDSGADVSYAKEGGMFAGGVLIGLANRQTFLDEGTDWILDDLKELADLLGIVH